MFLARNEILRRGFYPAKSPTEGSEEPVEGLLKNDINQEPVISCETRNPYDAALDSTFNSTQNIKNIFPDNGLGATARTGIMARLG